jgi:alpha-tubulin suppressor-like RCC1 family protein
MVGEPVMSDGSAPLGPTLLPGFWSTNDSTREFFKYSRFGITGSNDGTSFSVVNETSLYLWGRAIYGGLAALGDVVTDPVRLLSWSPEVKALQAAATDGAGFLLLDTGTIFSWGMNRNDTPIYSSQVTVTDPIPPIQGTPVEVDLSNVRGNGDRISKISCIYGACAGVEASGRRIYVWGNFPTTNLIPKLVDMDSDLPAGITILDMKGNHQFFVGLLSDRHSMICWSVRSTGVSGIAPGSLTVAEACGQTDLADTNAAKPVVLSQQFPEVTSIAVAAFHALFLSNGSIFGWGSCGQGNLGLCNYIAKPGTGAWVAQSHELIFDQGFVNSGWISIGTVGISSFALSEQGYLYRWGDDSLNAAVIPPPAPSQLPTALTNATFPATPAGYRIQSLENIVMQATHYYFTISVEDLWPTCNTPRPSPIFSCVGGSWVIYGQLDDSNGPITITAPVIVIGNLSTTTGIQYNLPANINENEPLLRVVNGCVTLGGDISIELTKEDLDKGSRRVTLLSAVDPTCTVSLSNAKATVNSPKSCKTAKISTSSTETSGTSSLVATITVDSSRCNVWWIVLVSVLGGVILIVFILAMLFTFNKTLKAKIRPFWVRSQPNSPPSS